MGCNYPSCRSRGQTKQYVIEHAEFRTKAELCRTHGKPLADLIRAVDPAPKPRVARERGKGTTPIDPSYL